MLVAILTTYIVLSIAATGVFLAACMVAGRKARHEEIKSGYAADEDRQQAETRIQMSQLHALHRPGA